jgi:hypothetical protein
MLAKATLGLAVILVITPGALASTKTHHNKSVRTAHSATTSGVTGWLPTRQPQDPVGHPVPGSPHGHSGPARYESF